MATYKKAVHRDANHKIIVQALRKAGMRVFDTAALGEGFPDIVVVRPDGTVRLVEIKSDTADVNASGATKMANEVTVMVSLVSETYRIVDSVEQALAALR